MPRVTVKQCSIGTVFLTLLVLLGKRFFKDINGLSRLKIKTNRMINRPFDEDILRRFKEIEPIYNLPDIDCLGLLENKTESHNKAREELPNFKGFRLDTKDYIEAAKDCDEFIRDFGYITHHLSQAEDDFPLGYSLVVFKDIEPVERLLRAVYRPQNAYCLHVDVKAKPEFYEAVTSITQCLPNVVVADRRVDVKWAEFSVLEVELVCMEELWKSKVKWKYFINLTGQEFPLMTNRELVEILTAYRGANDVEGVRRGANKDRWHKAGPVPENLTPTKGSVHVVLNRDFIDFILHTSVAQQLLNWTRPQNIADETFFATLNHNPQLGIPGSFVGLDDVEKIMVRKPWFGRYKSWLDWPCAGVRGRDICILTCGDLPRMHVSPFFFANKFYLNIDRIAYGCMEQRLFNHTRDLYLEQRKINTTVYEDSILVRNRLDDGL